MSQVELSKGEPTLEKVSKGPSPTESNTLNLLSLTRSINDAQTQLDKDVKQEGIIDQAIDNTKGYLGTSANSSSFAGRAWSHVLNSDESSRAVQKEINATTQIAMDASQGKTHLGDDTSSLGQNLHNRVASFEKSEKNSAEVVADVATLAYLGASRSVSARGAVGLVFESAVAKTAIKGLGTSSGNVGNDAFSGALLGLSLPAGKALGAGLTSTLTRESLGVGALKSAVTLGSQGASIGYAAEVGSIFGTQRNNGESAAHAMKEALTSSDSLKSAALGGITGVVGGAILGRFGETAANGTKTISKNGAETYIWGSGKVVPFWTEADRTSLMLRQSTLEKEDEILGARLMRRLTDPVERAKSDASQHQLLARLAEARALGPGGFVTLGKSH